MGRKVFFRMLPQAFIEHINNIRCDWWKKAMTLVNDRKIDVAMRNGYLNFYRYGQSIAKVTWKSRTKKPSAEIHRKYFGEHINSYTRREPDDLFLSEKALNEVLTNAERHSGDEKKGCHHIAANHAACVIDMEMGLPGLALRFDMVAALSSGGGSRLTFFEAKHSENDALRARNKKPTVLTQLEKYAHNLQKQKEDILAGYVSAVNTAKRIEIRGGCLQALAALAPESIEVDDQPRLVVFKPDQGARSLEECWQNVLREKGVDLIYAEDAKNIVLQ